MVLKTEILLEGLVFPESPRWHDNKLWFSDMDARKVMTVDMEGNTEVVVEMQTCPSGLGFLPDGKLLIVSMDDDKLLRLDSSGLAEVADLSGLTTYRSNDMVVDKQGRAYIGNFGYDYEKEPLKHAEIILVTPDGKTRVVADKMTFPNGTVITPDGKTLIVGETFAFCLTAFDIEKNGSLTGRRIWANIGKPPDGICLDAEGGIWIAAPGTGKVFRVLEGGKITDRIRISTQPYACMLGGPERRTLFVATSQDSRSGGRIETIKVDISGAGLP